MALSLFRRTPKCRAAYSGADESPLTSNLPPELWHTILSFASQRDLVRLSLTCRKFYALNGVVADALRQRFKKEKLALIDQMPPSLARSCLMGYYWPQEGYALGIRRRADTTRQRRRWRDFVVHPDHPHIMTAMDGKDRNVVYDMASTKILRIFKRFVNTIEQLKLIKDNVLRLSLKGGEGGNTRFEIWNRATRTSSFINCSIQLSHVNSTYGWDATETLCVVRGNHTTQPFSVVDLASAQIFHYCEDANYRHLNQMYMPDVGTVALHPQGTYVIVHRRNIAGQQLLFRYHLPHSSVLNRSRNLGEHFRVLHASDIDNRVVTGHRTGISCVQISPCGHFILSTRGYEKQIEVRNFSDLTLLHATVDACCSSPTFSPDSQHFAASSEAAIKLFCTHTGEVMHRFSRLQDQPYRLGAQVWQSQAFRYGFGFLEDGTFWEAYGTVTIYRGFWKPVDPNSPIENTPTN